MRSESESRIRELDEAYRGLDTAAILECAWSDFDTKLAMTSSFQTQSLPLLHIAAEVVPEITILFLDTGYHFPETLAYRDRLAREWGLKVRSLRARPQTPETTRGTELYRTDPDSCCYRNKVEPLRDAAVGYRALVSGIRRDQTAVRSRAAVVERRQGIVRIHPMLAWTEQEVFAYVSRHGLPPHPLSEKGYTSVGCAPCTLPVQIGESGRDGRWAGLDKTECGLHLPASPDVQRRRNTG